MSQNLYRTKKTITKIKCEHKLHYARKMQISLRYAIDIVIYGTINYE